MKKIFLFLIITLFTTANAVSKENENVKDCFEKVNRVIYEISTYAKSNSGMVN